MDFSAEYRVAVSLRFGAAAPPYFSGGGPPKGFRGWAFSIITGV